MLKSVGIVSRVDKKEALKLVKTLVTHLKEKGLNVFLEPNLAVSIDKQEMSTPISRMELDFVITVGGDGTILRTCLSLPKPEPPVFAINMGDRGFLAEIQPEETFMMVDRYLNGDFVLERCGKITSSIEGNNRLPDALNEVLISTKEPVKILCVNVWNGEKLVTHCQADALMVASQTGSTGYSLSAGGPVLDPETQAFVLTPICPLTTFHPIVFNQTTTITLEVVRPKNVLIVVDGYFKKYLEKEGAHISVTQSQHKTTFIRFKEDFYNRLKCRLLFTRGEEC